MVENPASRTPPGDQGILYIDRAALGRTQKYILWVQRKARSRDRRKWGSGNGCFSSVSPRGAKRWEPEGIAGRWWWGEGAVCTRVWAQGGGGGPHLGQSPGKWGPALRTALVLCSEGNWSVCVYVCVCDRDHEQLRMGPFWVPAGAWTGPEFPEVIIPSSWQPRVRSSPAGQPEPKVPEPDVPAGGFCP